MKRKLFSIVFERYIDSWNSEFGIFPTGEVVAEQVVCRISFSVGQFQLSKDCLDTLCWRVDFSIYLIYFSFGPNIMSRQ